jgi:hypothetical protein
MYEYSRHHLRPLPESILETAPRTRLFTTPRSSSAAPRSIFRTVSIGSARTATFARSSRPWGLSA